MFLLLCTAQVKIAQRIGLIQHLPTGTFDGCKKNREWDSESGVLWRIMFLTSQGVSSVWSSSMSATQCATCPACTSTTWRCYTVNCFCPLEPTPKYDSGFKITASKRVLILRTWSLIRTFFWHFGSSLGPYSYFRVLIFTILVSFTQRMSIQSACIHICRHWFRFTLLANFDFDL